MLKSVFRSRSEARDLLNDTDRHGRLISFLDRMIGEVERERAGLRGRQTSAGMNAAMYLQAEESGQLESGRRQIELEVAILYCERRMSQLDAQVTTLRQLKQNLATVLPRLS